MDLKEFGYLYVMHGVHSSGHFDWIAEVCWNRYFNKAINNLVDQYEQFLDESTDPLNKYFSFVYTPVFKRSPPKGV